MPPRIIATPDLIKEFQRIVYAASDDDTIELPTPLLTTIANTLDMVKKAKGAPRHSARIKLRKHSLYSRGRRKIAELKSDGSSPPADALHQVARELKRNPLLQNLSLATIKDRLQRRRRSGN
jgi:hypothetical protein